MVQVIFFLISILLLLIAPGTYSFGFCFLVHWLYIVLAVYNVYSKRKRGLLTFTFFFSVSFYFVNFVYPVIYYPINPYFSLFAHSFNEKLISYCTAVAFFAYSSFSLGLYRYNSKHKELNLPCKSTTMFSHRNPYNMILLLYLIFLSVFIIFIWNGGLNFFSHQFSGTSNSEDVESGYIFSLIQAIAYPLLIMVLLYPHKRKAIFVIPFCTILLVIFLVLFTGSRTFPMALLILIITFYSDNIKKIRLTTLFVGMIGGVLTLSIVGALRGGGGMIEMSSIKSAGDVVASKEADLFSFANELIINNRSLYSLIGYAQEHTYTYGLTLLGGILNVVPFLQSAFCSVTGIHPDFIGSATFNTFLESGHQRSQGLGTNAISDMYLAFGIIGVLMAFYYLGYIVSWLRNSKSKSLYYCIAYYILVSGAVYSCRSTILGNIKPIVWSMVIVWITSFILYGKRKKIKAKKYRASTKSLCTDECI